MRRKQPSIVQFSDAYGSEATEAVENSDQSRTSTVPVADFENRREEGRKVRKEEGNTSLTSFESERAQNPKSEKSKRACRLPADWQPSPEMAEFARSNGVDPERTAAVFRDYWVGVPDPKGRKVDWSATWRNWVRREDGMQPNPQRTAPSERRIAVNAAWAGVPDIEGV